MRVNFEDSLFDDGHIQAMARILGQGWDDDRVLGKLYWVYRYTQKAKFITGPIDRAVTICVLRFASDDECHAFLSAMVTAQLALRDANEITIKGNKKQIERLESWHKGKIIGGKVRAEQKKTQQIRKQTLADSSRGPAEPSSPISFLLSPDHLKDSDLFPQHADQSKLPHSAASKKIRKPRVVTEKSSLFARGVDRWFAEHRAVYGVDPPWGPVQGKQFASALRKCKAEEVLDLITQFFNGPYPDSIRDGHPLGDGYACFLKRISMLRADLLKPERRAKAAIEAKRLKLADEAAEDSDQLNRINALNEREGTAKARNCTNLGRDIADGLERPINDFRSSGDPCDVARERLLERASTGGSGNTQAINSPSVESEELEGRRFDVADLVQSVSTACSQPRAMEGARKATRGGGSSFDC